MGQLHGLDRDIPFRQFAAERIERRSAGNGAQQRQQLCLRLDNDAAGDCRQLRNEADELQGVAEAVVAPHQHAPPRQCVPSQTQRR